MATVITPSAAQLFARNPTVDMCYVVTDDESGPAFFTENLARLYADSLPDPPYTIGTFNRSDDPEVISAALATIKRDSGLIKAKAALPHAATQSELAAVETYMDELAEALGADELAGIDDPVVLSDDIVLARSRAVIGAWAASGMTVGTWAAQDVPTKEAAVVDYINALP